MKMFPFFSQKEAWHCNFHFVMTMNSLQIFATLTFVAAVGVVDGNDICSQAGCSCTRDEKSEKLNQVDCKCHDKQVHSA